MSTKDILSKKNVIKIKGKTENKISGKTQESNICLFNNFMKKKGVKIEVLNKKELPKLRKAFTPDIRRQKSTHLTPLEQYKIQKFNKEKEKVNKTLATIAGPQKNGRNTSLLLINNKQIRTLNVKI